MLQHRLTVDPACAAAKALEQYSVLRRQRLEMVHKKAQELAGMEQDMSLVEELIMYSFISLFSK